MKKLIIFAVLITLLILSLDDNKREDQLTESSAKAVNPTDTHKEIHACKTDDSVSTRGKRNFNMGFSTWPFGPHKADKNATYNFIAANSDIYVEQIDDKLPWSAWINSTQLPKAFRQEIQEKISHKISNTELVLSVSLLNSGRNDLIEDYNGVVPKYESLDDEIIEEAYYKHLNFLISQFQPKYLIIAMEANELKIHDPKKWEQYKSLMENIRTKLRTNHPKLILSESITLHNWFKPDVKNKSEFIQDISQYIEQNLDFAAISYYPFFKGQHTKSDFQQAFDFLHQQVRKPIAFVETTHLAEDLNVKSLKLKIKSNPCEQQDYLETLLQNAHTQNYKFIIWWAHRDYDSLWESFPAAVKDLGKLWRDTGLLDESGGERPVFALWQKLLNNNHSLNNPQ